MFLIIKTTKCYFCLSLTKEAEYIKYIICNMNFIMNNILLYKEEKVYETDLSFLKKFYAPKLLKRKLYKQKNLNFDKPTF